MGAMGSQKPPEQGPKKPRGRPGKGRVELKGWVVPAIKEHVERLARDDGRFPSFGKVLEAAIGFYVECLAISGGELDKNNFPKIPGFKVTPVPFPKSSYEHGSAKAGPGSKAASHRVRALG